MNNLSPTTRIALGLVLITISLFLLGDMLGLFPSRAEAIIKGRTALAESLAVQYSIAAQKRDDRSIKSGMRSLVSRNDDVLSAALRDRSGRIIATAGDHARYWSNKDSESSTPTQIQVPIYQGTRKWGVVEISFAPINEEGLFGLNLSPIVEMAIFIATFGFLAFLLFVRKTHKNIDPASIIPSRVTNALNSLAEGVLLLDSKGYIMLANTAFGKSLNIKPEKLIGKNASSLKWSFASGKKEAFPWTTAIETGVPQTGRQLCYLDRNNEKHTFMVNSSPVKDAEGENRGVLATFDDVTQLEEKNDQLEDMLGMLSKSRDEVKRQNDELQILATRDPLTDCLNRRSFFEKYEPVFHAARHNGQQLTCLMADIDLFKSINDRYGHSKGDEVISMVADTLRRSMRSTDTVCRYGGEEFCIILPGTCVQDALATAERARANIASARIQANKGEAELSVTASFGVSTLELNAQNLFQLIDQADKALYLSKDNGRNCVTVWDQDAEDNASGTGHGTEPGKKAITGHPGTPPVNSVDSWRYGLETVLPSDLDSLTGLPNRRIFHERIDESIKLCRKNRRHMAVMMLDLNTFKRINNALGYRIGDELLRNVSTRLLESLRKTDSVSRLGEGWPATSLYRLGGDEFGILLADMKSTEFTEQIVERIIETVTEQMNIDEHEIHLKCNIGISMFPGSGVDTDSLLNNAGMALYYAKRKDQNSYQLYSTELNNNPLHNLKLENDLRHAIERNELELHYQPKIELYSGKISGMEALLRWKHPGIGMVPPCEFIPVAEETGLISQLGEWVLNTACNKLREWESSGYTDVSLAVNLSALQFRQKNILTMVQNIISNTGANPRLLELEITESTIMDDIDFASAIMYELHNEGIRISIDDFGTGYSSLNHLKRFPINAVKIDRSFIRDITTDPDDAAIVGAIIAMAHGMGLSITAEGVETERQLEYLQRLRCDEIQGFLFSRPLCGEEAEELLKQSKNGAVFPGVPVRAVS